MRRASGSYPDEVYDGRERRGNVGRQPYDDYREPRGYERGGSPPRVQRPPAMMLSPRMGYPDPTMVGRSTDTPTISKKVFLTGTSRRLCRATGAMKK